MSYYQTDNFEKPETKPRFWKSTKFCVVLLAIIFVFSLCSYLWQINYISEKGYKIKDLENQISLLKEENEKLAISLVQMQSMSDLNGKVASLGMVSVNEIVYLNESAYLARR